MNTSIDLQEGIKNSAASMDELATSFLDQLGLSRNLSGHSHDHSTSGPALSRLPNELLLAIFQYFIADKNSPWHLTLICRRWRELVLGAATLWTDIHLDDRDLTVIPNHEKWKTSSGLRAVSTGEATICKSPTELEDALTRARSAPIRLHVRLTRQSVSSVDGWCTLFPRYTVCIQSLSLSPSSSRDSSAFVQAFSAALFHSADFHPLQNLAVLAQEADSLELFRVVQAASQLTRLSTAAWYFLRLHDACTQLTQRLQNLVLAGGFYEEKPQAFDNAISQYRNLHTLEIPGMDWPRCSSLEIQMVHLESLTVWCTPIHLEKLHLPALQTLDVVLRDKDGDCACQSRADSRPLSFPHLIRLTIASANDIHVAWIRKMEMPSLRDITLRGPALAPDPLLMMPPVPHLERISISTHAQTLLDRDSFQSMCSVQHIVFSCTTPDLERLGITLRALFTTAPCPRLQAVRVNSPFYYNSELDAYLEKVVRDGKERMPFLKYIRISWRDRGLQMYEPR